jgi:membrane-associated protease RseP (regulator of RpoE activity)
MLQALGVLAFVAALLLSVMLHEFGHFIFAKKFGMKVTEFFLGFGYKIWSFTKGETEFGIKAIPAGGYCRIVGMSIHEEMNEEDAPRAFVKASAPRRLIVLAAGSISHFILGFILIFVIFFGIGTSTTLPIIDQVLPCINTSATSNACPSGAPASPAQEAGLKAGDHIISINGVKVTNWSQDIQVVRTSAGKELNLIVERGGSSIAITATPRDVMIGGKHYGMLGIISKIGLQREGFVTSLHDTWSLGSSFFSTSIKSLISLPGKVPALFKQTFLGAKRDANGLVGVVGVAQASAATASDHALSFGDKLETFLLIIASLNIFIGIFNLLPLLPLDGGHMAVAVIDGYRRWRARRRGEQEPAPIDLDKLMPVTAVVFIFLVALSLMLLAADIFNPVHFNL